MKRKIIREVGFYLDICRECENNDTYAGSIVERDKKCAGCETFRKIRALGEKLNTQESKERLFIKMPFTYDEYVSMKNKRLSDLYISKKYQVPMDDLKQWKKKSFHQEAATYEKNDF